MPDAPRGPCTRQTKDLLVNGNFDAAPDGAGWMDTPLVTTLPTVTMGGVNNQGVSPHSPAGCAWMGGNWGTAERNTDILYQDVRIPSMTTSIVITGQYWTKSSEPSTATAEDTVAFTLETPGGTKLATVYSGGSNIRHEAWQPLNFSVVGAPAYSGETIRVKLSSTNDGDNSSHFWFDSLALTADFCE